MAHAKDKVCLNHPQTSAVSRCVTCFKPLCSECVVKEHDLDFCSEACATNYSRTNESIKDFGEKEAHRKLAKLVKKFVCLAILVIVGFLVYRYWFGDKGDVKGTADHLKNKTRELKRNLDAKLKE